MEEISSRWILQEVFTDPTAEGEEGEFTLNIKLSSEIVERGEVTKAVVEISGSITGKFGQVANIRFVNLTELSVGRKTKPKTILRRVERERVSELLSILPLYLLKAGIEVREIRREL